MVCVCVCKCRCALAHLKMCHCIIILHNVLLLLTFLSSYSSQRELKGIITHNIFKYSIDRNCILIIMQIVSAHEHFAIDKRQLFTSSLLLLLLYIVLYSVFCGRVFLFVIRISFGHFCGTKESIPAKLTG